MGKVDFNSDGTVVVSCSYDGILCLQTIPAHSDPVTAVDFNPDGTVIVSCSYDGLCRLWNMEDGACLATMMDKENPPVSFVKFSPNGHFLLTGTLDNQLKLWNVEKQQRSKQYTGGSHLLAGISTILSDTPPPPGLLASSHRTALPAHGHPQHPAQAVEFGEAAAQQAVHR